MRGTFIFVLLVVIFFNLQGQEIRKLNIDEAVRMALENHIPYILSQQEVKIARYKAMENNSFLPELSLRGSRILKEKLMSFEMPEIPGMPSFSGELDFTKNYEFTFNITQPLFTGGKIWLNSRNYRWDIQIAKEKEKNSREDTTLNVKRVYYTVQILEQLKKAHQEALTLTENNYNNIKQSYELGMVSQYDLLRAEMAVSSMKPEISRTDNMLERTLSTLKMMIGVPEQTPLQLEGELTYRPFEIDQVECIEQSLNNRSEIIQLDMEMKKMNNVLKMTWAQYIPDIALVGSYTYRSDFFKFKDNKWENYGQIAIGLNFPIFPGLKREGQIGQAKVAKKMIELNRKQLSEATVLEVKSKIRTIREEYENILLGEKNVETAREGVRIAELSYKEGLITLLELNSSFNEMTRARVFYLQALFNYNIAIAELDKLTRSQIQGGIS